MRSLITGAVASACLLTAIAIREPLAAVVMTTALSGQVAAQDLLISRSGSRASTPAAGQHFSGPARVETLFEADGPSRVSGSSVTFAPGARTAWHTHPLGQVLIVTAGKGRVQRWDGPVVDIVPGDVARIPPNVKHWHGASETESMTHLAILEHLDGTRVTWMEHVADAGGR